MRFASILALAVGLAMDAMAVSAARGVAVPKLRVRHAVLVALFFGGFQAGMPLLGALLGRELGPFVAAWTHWIAFALLAGVGAKMLHEAWSSHDDDKREPNRDPFALEIMCILAIATSIDAFAVGITLPMVGAPLALSLVTIGVTTAILSVVGLVAGRHFGAMLGSRLDAFGGIVLILLGVKVLADHFMAR